MEEWEEESTEKLAEGGATEQGTGGKPTAQLMEGGDREQPRSEP